MMLISAMIASNLPMTTVFAAAKKQQVKQETKKLEEQSRKMQQEIKDLDEKMIKSNDAYEACQEKLISVQKQLKKTQQELKEAKAFCEENGIRHLVCHSEELDIEGFRQNPKNRCYLCKHELFEKILKIARENNIAAVAEGSNMDDNGDYRPGLVAVKELQIKSPLREAGLNKAEIRELSRELGLKTWDKQSFACLSSRFVYGETISEEKLHMVDLAEQYLLDLGFHQVRVRIHGMMARIEVLPEELQRLMEEENRTQIYACLKKIGFAYVTVDLGGYRTGSMNETLTSQEREKGQAE